MTSDSPHAPEEPVIRPRFHRRAVLGKWPFLWRTWLEAVVLAVSVGWLVQWLMPAGPRRDLAEMTTWGLVGLVLFVGPLIETLAFQCAPLEVASALRVRRWIRIALSVIPFAFMHRLAGMPTVVAAGMIGGFYFACTYERWRKESLAAAVGMTFLLHSSFNLVGVLGQLVTR